MGAAGRGAASAAERWGLYPRYEDFRGLERKASEEGYARVLDIISGGRAEPPPSTVQVIGPGDEPDLQDVAEIATEDGGRERIQGELPPDLPLGYHRLIHRSGDETALISSPGRCYLPEPFRVWGWAVQLYALTSLGGPYSHATWGIGDLSVLLKLARWARDQGAGVLMLNPLHAVDPGLPQETSPYFPSSRCFRNPLYLDVADIAHDAGVESYDLSARALALNEAEHIDRDAVYKLKITVLEKVWAKFEGDPRFDRYCAEQGDLLRDFATYMALAEAYGAVRSKWPGYIAHPRAAGVERWRTESADRVRFHMWLQWLLDQQLARAASTVGLIHDLSIGVSAGGADAWMWGDVFAQGVSVGAPPDEFNAAGQDWALPPWDPFALRAAEYEPFIRTIRAGVRHGAGLRVDHVMGLFRLWWIPEGMSPSDGVYVRYPFEDLLKILALESQRARAFIVGEDLGTVEPIVRREMQQRGLLSYRITWFEDQKPVDYPELSLAAVTNHDLPTIAGVLTGADLDDQRAAGIEPDEGVIETLRAQIENLAGATSAVDQAIVDSYAALAGSPSAVVLATLEDACAALLRPNLPGTTNDQRANWSIPLPLQLEQLITHPRPAAIARAIARGR